ncbi:hypothetical protein ACFQ3N_04660 [Virgibacillus byunsanensis]|uniref:NAD(P)-binding domain-containing protein n=1 Tax=Virgibacillus byunsanensis TaxID=570945 RepID=A0ABW3LIP1_9BACI
MLYLVSNCYDWIGYHLVTTLLENGCHVEGIGDTSSQKQEHLSMFFARNDLFTEVSKPKTKEYDVAYLIGDDDLETDAKAKRTVRLNDSKKSRNHNQDTLNIKLPLLFGEWMPMNEEGIYDGDEFISFDSTNFQTNAIHVEDFMKSLLQWTKSTNIATELEVFSEKNKDRKEIKLENSIFLRDNIPMDESLEKVKSHYKQFRKFY